MNAKKISLANNIYLILAGLFITSLVASNLIFTKIFYWYPFDVNLMGVKLFELSDDEIIACNILPILVNNHRS